MAEHFVFVVSGGRTGTQFLGDLMSSVIENCYSEHEPDIFRGFERNSFAHLRRFGIWNVIIGRALGLTGIRVLGTRYLTGKSDFAETAHKMRTHRCNYHTTIGQGLLIESYYAWWTVAPRLGEIFPGSKVVGVVRDPKQWIESWRKKAERRAEGHWTHKLPPGPINAQSVGDQQWAGSWERLSEIGKLAWQWSYINQQIIQNADSGSSAIYKFEEIFDPTSGKLKELCEFAAHFPDRTYAVSDPTHLISDKRNASSARSNGWRDWSEQDRQLVNEICGPLMERFGYELL